MDGITSTRDSNSPTLGAQGSSGVSSNTSVSITGTDGIRYSEKKSIDTDTQKMQNLSTKQVTVLNPTPDLFSASINGDEEKVRQLIEIVQITLIKSLRIMYPWLII